MKESEFVAQLLGLPSGIDATGDKLDRQVLVAIGPDRIHINRIEKDGHGNILMVVR